MSNSNVAIAVGPAGFGTILVDGTELHGVTGFTMTSKPGHLTQVTLELDTFGTGVDAENAEVFIPNRTRETLLALGWTPPEDSVAIPITDEMRELFPDVFGAPGE